MLFDANRLQRLSGLVDHHTYRSIAINEQLEVGVAGEEFGLQPPMAGVEDVIDIEDDEMEDVEVDVGAVQVALGDLADAVGMEVVEVEEEEALEPGVEEFGEEELSSVAVESRLRGAIRKEVRAVIEEVMADRDEGQVEAGLQNHSIAQAMGYASGHTTRTTKKNRALSAGPGFAHGFGGPGFM